MWAAKHKLRMLNIQTRTIHSCSHLCQLCRPLQRCCFQVKDDDSAGLVAGQRMKSWFCHWSRDLLCVNVSTNKSTCRPVCDTFSQLRHILQLPPRVSQSSALDLGFASAPSGLLLFTGCIYLFTSLQGMGAGLPASSMDCTGNVLVPNVFLQYSSCNPEVLRVTTSIVAVFRCFAGGNFVEGFVSLA